MNTKISFPHGMPVEWHAPATFSVLQETLADWLFNTGSLTERLQSHCASFEVLLIGQGNAALDASEQSFFGEAKAKQVEVREVILLGDKKPWVYARSVISQALCKAELANLGQQPLGKRIFNDPSFVRSDFEVGRLLLHPLSNATLKDRTLYARRSLFAHGNDGVLVAEAFLPDAPCYWEPC